MCYSVYLSTDSEEDLSKQSTDLVRFEKVKDDDPLTSLLEYEARWYVGSRSGCGCTFRHLVSIELGFGEPVHWYQEEDDEINATLSFLAVIRRMIREGYQLDCIDAWSGAGPADIVEKDVDLKTVADEEFRFFENHHFRFS
jgi:hypothetical protein